MAESASSAPKPAPPHGTPARTESGHAESVHTEPERPVMTPRGGFVAPKPPARSVDRDAPSGAQRASNVHDRDPTTLIKVPTAKPLRGAPADSPSTPPVDTSRTDPPVPLPAVLRNSDKRPLVIVAAALLGLLAAALLAGVASDEPALPLPAPTPRAAATPANKPPTPREVPTATRNAFAPATRAPDAIATPRPALSTEPSTRLHAAESPSASPKSAPTAKPALTERRTPAGAKPRPRFDPGKPWEED